MDKVFVMTSPPVRNLLKAALSRRVMVRFGGVLAATGMGAVFLVIVSYRRGEAGLVPGIVVWWLVGVPLMLVFLWAVAIGLFLLLRQTYMFTEEGFRRGGELVAWSEVEEVRLLSEDFGAVIEIRIKDRAPYRVEVASELAAGEVLGVWERFGGRAGGGPGRF